ncbi:putative NADH-flavin reductase [Tamaricihabitans halophyticus]|uniref:Putative NADH-flavin reductase n=1 Tax=Tamaricihabitans halophyticus TaxID=1262583 RepID=A0A4R2QXE3_9PSEU|nr:NAD(P)-binding oxidoreductase [Tamaricihabitans halophyticus]TCP53984.1 putative NADH-flavin reductase [Tamaricihabitans halophyticus]
MKITVFGATGGVGQQVVTQAADAGHAVTAVVRTTGKLLDSRATEVRADVLDPAAIVDTVNGADAVISAIGPRDNGPSTVCVDSARSIMKAMEATGTTRFVMVSALGFHTDGDGPVLKFVLKPIVKRILRHAFADMAMAEQAVQASNLNWTLLRPPRLLDKPRTGNYRTAINRTLPRGLTVARADVADCALRVIDEPKASRAAIALAN